MSSEHISANEAAAAQEFPDRIGFKPDNPYLVNFKPYIPAGVNMPELTVLPLIMGTFLGIIFGASSLYLVLKVGLTVSASIPVAVISITLFRLLSKFGLRGANILENNIVQTAGSAGESIAFGLGVTMPAIMILGFDLEITRVMLVAILGGLLGILMMIPLRRALIVAQHGYLKYPEGTACAEVLKAGADEDSKANASPEAKAELEKLGGAAIGAKTIFAGFGIGFLYQLAMAAFKGWKDTPEKIFGKPFEAGSVSAEISPTLLGVGYIIGPRIASIMCAGGVLSYLVLIPMIKYFGGPLADPLAPVRSDDLISGMAPDDIRNAYVLYIGAGAVAAGGIISLGRSLPTIWHGLKAGLQDLRGSKAQAAGAPRTEQDLSMKWVIGGIVLLVIAIVAFRTLQMNLLGAVLIVIFGFLFVTVSSRLTGEIGSSSNPISGMTVATLLLTCLIFLVVGWTSPLYYVTALSVGAIVCIAASNGGTTSQDLKTGFLVGSTPKYQQIAILAGALASALVLGPILLKLNDAGTVYAPPTTFEPVSSKDGSDISLQLAPPVVSGLPAYTDEDKPKMPGNYRILKIAKKDNREAMEKQAPELKDLGDGEYLVDESGKVARKVRHNFAKDLRADMSQLGREEKLTGPQATQDGGTYRTWIKTDPTGEHDAERYLVDAQGVPHYLVDPGINGSHKYRPDETKINKFSAPKATLMSYIIKGVLSHKLPWGLVLLGVMIAIVLEMSGIPSLAFAVGVYLPLSSSSPIFIGGMIRLAVDRYLRRKHAGKNLTEEQLTAEGDKSPGVLLASGYIAGGALAGIVIAFMAGALKPLTDAITDWSKAHNPFFYGPNSNLLSMIPFVLLVVMLYLVGRDVLLKARGGNANS
jgi:putative OPT family oligopeptide transporter